MNVNPDHIINSIDHAARTHYRDGEQVDRLAYEVGMLRGKIRELCRLMQDMNQEIEQLKLDAK